MTATASHRRQLLTTGQAADRAGVHQHTIVRWVAAGLLPCRFTLGGHRRIDAADLDALTAEAAR